MKKTSDFLLLDTHIFLWYVLQDKKLTRLTESIAIEKAIQNSCAYISLISIWEIAMLVQKKRLKINSDPRTWVMTAIKKSKILVSDLTINALIGSTELMDLRSKDPADRIILATALENNMKLVTKDKHIVTYCKKHNLDLLNL